MRSLLRRLSTPANYALEAEAALEAKVNHIPSWSTVRSSLLGLWTSHDPHGHAEPHEEYRLYRTEDNGAWLVFFVAFIVLILFDNLVMHRKHERIPFKRAMLFSVFWLSCAGLFCVYVWLSRGKQDAFDWATGYILEWMLSVDNLFVFRSIFLVFKTPDEQKHKPLFWGIVGAVVFRMAFFVVGELFVHAFWWAYILLGAFLVYTGVKILFVEDDEGDPTESAVYNQIIKFVPYADAYSPKGRFFERIDLNSNSGEVELNDWIPPTKYSVPEGSEKGGKKLIATRLTLVVICLEVTDVVFAVDSVSAIVAQIPDLFLAYTACVFAMLGLRATFFVVDELVKLFTLLPYAVAGILVFIGVKLILKTWVHVPPEVVCIVITSALSLSILCSIAYDNMKGRSGCEACCEALSTEDCCMGAEDEEYSPIAKNARSADLQGIAAAATQEERLDQAVVHSSKGSPAESNRSSLR